MNTPYVKEYNEDFTVSNPIQVIHEKTSDLTNRKSVFTETVILRQ